MLKETTKTTQLRKRPFPKEKQPTVIDVIADKIVIIFGTWKIFFLHILWFGIWVYFDFDIITLTFWVSLEAILLALLILISQNRQAEIDRIRAWTDLEVDRHAEKQTRILIEMVKEVGEKVGIKDFKIKSKLDGEEI